MLAVVRADMALVQSIYVELFQLAATLSGQS